MKFPLSWLKEFVDITQSPDEIGKLLTSLGIELESLETFTPSFEGVVVAKVLHTEKHPNADKLCIASLTDGLQTYQVVCGGPNCRAGIHVAFAKVGAVLRDEKEAPFKITKAKVRGIESSGMLVSEKELNVGLEDDKIIEFSDDLPLGLDLTSFYKESIFEVGLTPNLGHCSNILGIAREVASATNADLKQKSTPTLTEGKEQTKKFITLDVQNSKSCPQYFGRMIKDVKVASSPEWLKRKLISSGLRPINNVVDCVNYIVLETGQPLHAFDYSKIEGKKIIVRNAKEGEKMTSLDNHELLLNTSDLIIADNVKPIALAGIIGGQNSEVTETTTDILLEAAFFNPSIIRKTSKRLGISTDASKRFERGIDHGEIKNVLTKAVNLIHQICGGTILEGALEFKDAETEQKPISCRLKRINALLGTKLSFSEVEDIFKRLKFEFTSDGQEIFTVKIPTFRKDLISEIDLIEEVARIYGYDNIPKPLPKYHGSTINSAPIFLFEREVRAKAISEGLQEFITCDLIGPSILSIIKEDLMDEKSTIKVLNPTSIEQSILRTSLLPGLLQVAFHNFSHQQSDVSGFEIGRIHFKEGENYCEQSMLALLLMGQSSPHHFEKKDQPVDFFDIKGIVENVLKKLSIPTPKFKVSHRNIFHSGRQASIFVGDLEIGMLGEIHPAIVRRLDIPERIYFAEINLQDLLAVKNKEQRMKALPCFPSSERDFTITLPESITLESLFEKIKNVHSTLLEEAFLLDIYRHEKLGRDVKNVTLRFVYRDNHKTIEQEAVESEHQKIIQAIQTI